MQTPLSALIWLVEDRLKNGDNHTQKQARKLLEELMADSAPDGLYRRLGYESVEYPCGCRAAGPTVVGGDSLPNHCPEHGKPPVLSDGKKLTKEELKTVTDSPIPPLRPISTSTLPR